MTFFRAARWEVVSGTAQARPVYDLIAKKSLAVEDPALVQVMAEDHNATRQFVSQAIGRSAEAIASYLALVQDDPGVQIVNDAQRDYTRHFIQGDPDLDKLPVLSAAAPFKAGGRKNDPAGYTFVDKSQLTLRNAADLYPNTLVVVKASGAEIKQWLECSAGQFNQIEIPNPRP